MNVIKPLEPLLINQIAAGEVIERPASVVKECLENSLDAHATKIVVTCDNGGKDNIIIQDNGTGISRDDLLLAVQQYATSKIATFTDLENIQSFGFRGEALASISAISRFCIQSRHHSATEAWQLKFAGKLEQAVIQPCAHPVGTTIIVRDLFFNTPARRKFLRMDETELLQIENVIKRVALTRADIAIQFIHNEKSILRFPVATTEAVFMQRIAKIFSKSFVAEAHVIAERRGSWQLRGWVAPAELTRNQSDCQYFYVNGRIVKDKLLQHAVRQAYGEQLPAGRYAMYLLYFTCQPHEVDVNVHPTKHEVRFHNARDVHDFIYTSLSNALNGESEAVPVLQIAEVRPTYQAPLRSATAAKPVLQHNIITVLQQRYLLLQQDENIILLDSWRAYRDWLLHGLQQSRDKPQSKPLLLPETITFPRNIAQLDNLLTALTHLGFDIALLSEQSLIVRSIPVIITPDICRHLIEAALQYWQRTTETTQLCEAMVRDVRCHFSKLAVSEQQHVLDYILAQQQGFSVLNLEELCS